MQGVPGNEPGNLCSGCDGDISRLVEQITDLERIETESLEGIAKMEFSIKEVEAELSKETKIYMFHYAKDSEELTRRQNDLDVFQFSLTFTRCEGATSWLQISANESRICQVQGGGRAICSQVPRTRQRMRWIRPRQ